MKILIFFFVAAVFSTAPLSTLGQKDSIPESTSTEEKAKEHSPAKAMAFSAVIPGLGQAYNKKYWKIPIIYAGLAAGFYFINFNTKEYKFYKQAYLSKIDGDPGTVDLFPAVPANGLKSTADSHRRNIELSYIGTAAVYLLNVIDASVDAHLFNFDVSDDLSLRIQPAILPNLGRKEPVTGFSLSLKL